MVTAPVLQLFACHKLLALSFKRKKLGKKKKGYICDVGSWQLPEVPLAPIRETAAPRGAGKPQGMWTGGREQVLRVGMELQCRMLNIINSFLAPGEDTCCCLPLLKHFPPGLQCNSGVWEKAGLFKPFLLGASAH